MSGYIPSPADYAGFLMAARQQQLLLLQHLQRPPPSTPARSTQSSSALHAAPPDPKDLVPLQPLLPDWMANAFGIPLLSMPVGECRGMPRAPLPVPQPFSIPSGLWGSLGHRPLVPPPVSLGNAGQRPAQDLLEQQFVFAPGISFPHPINMHFINGARPGHPYPLPFPPVPELSPTVNQKGLLVPPVAHLPPLGNVLQSAPSPPADQPPSTKLKRLAEKPRDNELEEGNGEYPVKRTRLVWTPHLHRLFVDAVEKLGEDAVPKNIMQVMDVEGLTRSNVASHLQKYRLQLKKQPKGGTSRRASTPDDAKARMKPKFSARVANSDGQCINILAPSLACTTEGKCTSTVECRKEHVLESQILGVSERGDEVHPSIGLSDDPRCMNIQLACATKGSVGCDSDGKPDVAKIPHQSEKSNRSSGSEMHSCTKLIGNSDSQQPNHVENRATGADRLMHDLNPDPGPEPVD